MSILEEMAEEELADVRARGEKTWNTAEFEQDFELVGYVEPDLCVARRNGQTGVLRYVANRDGWPRTFFGWRTA